MQAILQQYDISELRAHQQDGTLASLHGIVTHKAKVINSFLQECDRSSMSDTYVRIGALLRQLTPTVTWRRKTCRKSLNHTTARASAILSDGYVRCIVARRGYVKESFVDGSTSSVVRVHS